MKLKKLLARLLILVPIAAISFAAKEYVKTKCNISIVAENSDGDDDGHTVSVG